MLDSFLLDLVISSFLFVFAVCSSFTSFSLTRSFVSCSLSSVYLPIGLIASASLGSISCSCCLAFLSPSFSLLKHVSRLLSAFWSCFFDRLQDREEEPEQVNISAFWAGLKLVMLNWSAIRGRTNQLLSPDTRSEHYTSQTQQNVTLRTCLSFNSSNHTKPTDTFSTDQISFLSQAQQKSNFMYAKMKMYFINTMRCFHKSAIYYEGIWLWL